MWRYTALKRFYARRSKSYIDPGEAYQPMDEAERDKLLRTGCISEAQEPAQEQGDDDGDD